LVEKNQEAVLRLPWGPRGAGGGQARVLQWLVFLRVVISFFILSTSYFLYAEKNLHSHYYLIGGNVGLTLFSAIFIDRFANRQWFILCQIYWDVIFVTMLIYITGGFFSLFNFMYILTIIFAATLSVHPHSILVPLLCALFYDAILVGQYFNVLTPLTIDPTDLARPTVDEIIVKVFFNPLAFVISGMLASYLAKRSRAADEQAQRHQREMEELKILNENIVHSLPVGLLTCDAEDKINFANVFAAPILNLQGAALRGRFLRELLPGLDAKAAPEGSFDLEYQDPQGRRKILSVATSDLRNAANEIFGRVISLQDVTAVRALEDAAKQADRQAAIGQLAAAIAHEIRNPLASLSGSIQMLRDELELEPVQAHLMDIVMRETDRLNALIGDFLTYARPTKFDETEVDLSQLLEEQLQVLANDPAFEQGIVLEKELQSNLICRIDKDQIRQLFWNLCINALQSMSGRKGTLTVRARDALSDPPMAEMEVIDTGSGIPAQNLKAIFDPFFTTKEGGSGLGLPIAYRIVENHKGKIIVDSSPGKGSTFRVLLPSHKHFYYMSAK